MRNAFEIFGAEDNIARPALTGSNTFPHLLEKYRGAWVDSCFGSPSVGVETFSNGITASSHSIL